VSAAQPRQRCERCGTAVGEIQWSTAAEERLCLDCYLDLETTVHLDEVAEVAEPLESANENPTARAQDGATFILDAELEVPAIWGHGGDVVWSDGEPLKICGPQGVGKTALTQQLSQRRMGIRPGELLGLPIQSTEGRILYIAADRPRQSARSFRRMVTEADRQALESKLIVWKGPLPFDLGQCERGALMDFVSQWSEISDVYIDALKDVAVKLTDDEVGARVNAEFQEVIANGVQVVVDHHQRKAGSDNKKPTKLADVYGSVWLTAGCGSVLLLWGDAGDPIVEVRHLKQPSGEFGPTKLLHNHQAGTVSLYEAQDLESMAQSALGNGLTVRLAAMELYGTANPTANQIEKARGKLNRHPGLVRIPGTEPVAYRSRGKK
jgi:hypothetical protein